MKVSCVNLIGNSELKSNQKQIVNNKQNSIAQNKLSFGVALKKFPKDANSNILKTWIDKGTTFIIVGRKKGKALIYGIADNSPFLTESQATKLAAGHTDTRVAKPIDKCPIPDGFAPFLESFEHIFGEVGSLEFVKSGESYILKNSGKVSLATATKFSQYSEEKSADIIRIIREANPNNIEEFIEKLLLHRDKYFEKVCLGDNYALRPNNDPLIAGANEFGKTGYYDLRNNIKLYNSLIERYLKNIETVVKHNGKTYKMQPIIVGDTKRPKISVLVGLKVDPIPVESVKLSNSKPELTTDFTSAFTQSEYPALSAI